MEGEHILVPPGTLILSGDFGLPVGSHTGMQEGEFLFACLSSKAFGKRAP